ncbi:MAG: VTT domain-containing protein [Thermosphaera sp.]
MFDIQVLKGLGFSGIFLISFISNAIPYSTIPYLFWLVPVFAIYQGNLSEYLLLIFLSSLGASMGKLVVYFIGRGFTKIGAQSRIRRNLDFLASEHSNALFLTLILFTALPLPDDVIILPLGYAKYDIVKYMIGLLIGKFIVTSLAALYGRGISVLLTESFEAPLWLIIVVYAYLTLMITYVAGSIDWIKLGGLARKAGFIFAFKYFIEALIKGVISFHSFPLRYLKKRR